MAAWAGDLDIVRGLLYPRDKIDFLGTWYKNRRQGRDRRVRRRWIIGRRARKRDNLQTCKVRIPGGIDQDYVWAATYDERVWYVCSDSIEVKRVASAQGAVDRLAGLTSRPRTVFVT